MYRMKEFLMAPLTGYISALVWRWPWLPYWLLLVSCISGEDRFLSTNTTLSANAYKVWPNPFHQQTLVEGLSPNLHYEISMFDSKGGLFFKLSTWRTSLWNIREQKQMHENMLLCTGFMLCLYASFSEALIIFKIFKIDVFISAERGKQGGFNSTNFNW